MSDSLNTLPDISWVQALRTDDRDLLSSYGEFIPAHPGQDLIKEGDAQNNLYLIISGTLEVRRAGALSDQIIATLSPGESIGEISIFDPGPASASVAAKEFAQLWRINREELIQFIEDNPGAGNMVLISLITLLAQRLRNTGAPGVAD